MTEATIALREYLRNVGMDLDSDFMRDGVALLVKLLMEMEVGEKTGAEWYQRSEERQCQRNGYRDRGWERLICGFRSCGEEVTIPAFWSREGEGNEL